MEKVGSFFGNRNGSFMKIYYPLLRWRRGTRPVADITSITHITNSIFDVERFTTAIASIYFYSKQTCITPIKRSAWIRSIHVFLPFFLSLSLHCISLSAHYSFLSADQSEKMQCIHRLQVAIVRLVIQQKHTKKS